MRRRDVLLAGLCLPFLAACGRDEDAVRVDLSRREEPVLRQLPRAVTYAYLPQYAHTVSYERHRLLLDYIGRATGIPLRQIFPDTFEEHVRMVERGEIDISFSNPFAYIRMAAGGARAFARIIEPSGKPDFKSQIICRRDNKELKTITAIVISTLLACYGQIIFLQNIGTINTYSSHEQTGIFAIAALLIGGATVAKAGIANAFIGVLLFHLMFVISPLAGKNLIGDAQLGEYFRVFVSYGIIAVTLLLHAWRRRSDAEARRRAESDAERAEEEAAS